MSRRLAADNRPKGQNLQESQRNGGSVRELRDAQTPRRKSESQRRPRHGGDRAARGPPGRRGDHHESLSPRASRAEDRPCFKSGEDFMETNQRNVFIDSYYPKLRSDVSENYKNSEKSSSECGEMLGKGPVSIRLGTGDSPESDSRMSFETAGRASAKEGLGRREYLGDGLEYFCDEGIQVSTLPTFQQSSRSRLTLDSKTYTVSSYASDIEPAIDGMPTRTVNASNPRGRMKSGAKGTKEKRGPNVTAVEWFAQLHRRIETLEDLLQETLVSSCPLKESDGTKKAEIRQKSVTRKGKVPPPEASRTENPGGGMLEAKEASASHPTVAGGDAGEESTDTDNELQTIKKRVRELEMKLQKTKLTTTTSNSDNPSADPHEPAASNSGLALAEVGPRKEDRRGRPQFVNLDDMGTFPSVRPKKKEAAHERTRRKMKKNIMAKCKGFKGMCHSVISSRKSSPRNHRPVEVSDESNVDSCWVAKDSVDPEFPPEIYGGARETATVLRVTCQRERSLTPLRNSRKKKRKKQKNLCKKTSVTDFLFSGVEKFQNLGEASRQPCWVSLPGPNGVPLGDHEAAPWKNPCEGEAKKPKPRKKHRPSRNPIDVLKRGGLIKIPVLFKEICGKPKSGELEQKVSSISITFVLVEKDTRHPLKKLIRKLSLGSSPSKEQYAFGVGKCRCDGEVHRLCSKRHRNDPRPFIGG